jgi:hypothetical protein
MKTNVFLGIGLRIIILFTVGMFMTYLPNELTEFFGDEIVHTSYGQIEEWGARHYWYNTMMFLLFILSLINVIISIVKLVNKNYNTDNWPLS